MQIQSDTAASLKLTCEGALKVLHAAIAKADAGQFARIHAIWALGQLHRRGNLETSDALASLLLPLLDDNDAEIRAQAANILGDCRQLNAWAKLVSRLTDDSPRVQPFAAQALGKLGRNEAIPPLITLLAANDDRDPVLRHAAVMGLVGSSCGSAEILLPFAKNRSTAARMGVLLALRRLNAEQVASLLDDADPRIVVEAARAIYDVPISAAMPKLAELISRGSQDEALMRRVLAGDITAAAFDAEIPVDECLQVEIHVEIVPVHRVAYGASAKIGDRAVLVPLHEIGETVDHVVHDAKAV